MSSFDEFHSALEEGLKDRLSSVVHVASYDETTEKIATPAVLINLDDFTEDLRIDEGTPLHCNFSAYCVIGAEKPGAEMDVRKFAAEVVRLIRKLKHHGLDGVQSPESLTAMPATFRPDSKKYTAWVVMWEQTIVLPEELDAGELVPFITFHADHEQATDAPVASDTVTLDQ